MIAATGSVIAGLGVIALVLDDESSRTSERPREAVTLDQMTVDSVPFSADAAEHWLAVPVQRPSVPFSADAAEHWLER